MRIKILNRVWQLIWVGKGESVEWRKGKIKGNPGHEPARMSTTDQGMTESPELKSKRMFIREGLKPKEELDTVIHECLHAADWYKDEDWIETVATDIAHVLWKMGWRKKDAGSGD